MTFYDYLFIGLAAMAVLIVLVFAIRTKTFFKTIAISGVIGLITLLVLYFTSSFTGFKLEITPFSIGTSVVFGLPGVVCMVICKMVFGL